ncbi:hypothetical protein HELRODRAFT_173763 [Helobdella robusta]|uniref:Uncharacterized protein n=1 Tax=Helobdella robusta TaxID=6412 RepID=T1F772_HELRO|nr:hypothetical protein HELRODRAFT_173763 [Helobdella robusta]ESO03462.1 hypothetical protein HELRODRAFT_173763 [Helobdella robusta]
MDSTYLVEPLLIEEPDESSVVNAINGVEYLVRRINAHCSDSLSFTFTIDGRGREVKFVAAFENIEEYEPGEFICRYKGKGITVGADPGYGTEEDKFFVKEHFF